MEQDTNTPEELKPSGEGARLWQWLTENADGVMESRPLVIELCQIADRLHEVRVKLAQQGLTVSAARGRIAANPLLGTETRLLKQYENLWRTIGLADEAAEEKRPVGRPPGT